MMMEKARMSQQYTSVLNKTPDLLKMVHTILYIKFRVEYHFLSFYLDFWVQKNKISLWTIWSLITVIWIEDGKYIMGSRPPMFCDLE